MTPIGKSEDDNSSLIGCCMLCDVSLPLFELCIKSVALKGDELPRATLKIHNGAAEHHKDQDEKEHDRACDGEPVFDAGPLR